MKLTKLTAVLLLSACASGPADVATPTHRKPSGSAKRYMAKNGWDIKSVKDIPSGVGTVRESGGVIVWDLEGAILDGKNQKGDGSQNEVQEPLLRARVPLIIRNGFVQNNKNAMTFYDEKSGIIKLTFTNIGEDAVATLDGAYNFVISDSEFINDKNGDKSVQLNEARGAEVRDSLIYSGLTCMRIGDSDTTSVSETATVKGNRFLGCDTGVHASKITVQESANKYDSVNTPWKGSNGAVKK